MEIDVEEPDADGAGGAAGDNDEPETPEHQRRFLPSSVGLTVLLSTGRHGDRGSRLLGRLPDRTAAARSGPAARSRCPRSSARTASQSAPERRWSIGCARPKNGSSVCHVRMAAASPIVVPESAAEQRRGGGLALETHSRLFSYTTPEGHDEQVRALTVFLVNRRATVHRFYADVSYAFQARLELVCETGFRPRRDLSGYRRIRIGICGSPICTTAISANGRWAATRLLAGTIEEDAERHVTRVWTDPLPSAEVERVAPNEDAELKSRVTFGMEAFARAGRGGRRALASGSRRSAESLRDMDRCGAQEAGRSSAAPPRNRRAADRRDGDGEEPHREGIEILSRNDARRGRHSAS